MWFPLTSKRRRNMHVNVVAVAAVLVQLSIILEMHPTSGAKILMVPAGVKSHVMYFGQFGVELARLGHAVHMLVPSTIRIPSEFDDFAGNRNSTSSGNGGRFNTTVYEVDDVEAYVGSPAADQLFVKMALSQSVFEKFKTYSEFNIEYVAHMEGECVRLLENRPIMDFVLSEGFQFAIMDMLVINCYHVLPYAASIPHGTLSIALSSLLFRVPRLPSIQSVVLDMDVRSFGDRFVNLMFQLTNLGLGDVTSTAFIEKYAPGRPVLGPGGLVQRMSLWFYLEHVAVGQPQPLMPNTVVVGDLMRGRQTGQLPPEIDSFIQRQRTGSDDDDATNRGTIVVSFGSFFDSLPDDVVAKFCDAFRGLPARMTVVWKMKNSTACDDDRILLRRWIPQTDLLADPRVRLLITHAGFNSLVESAYHGKPIIAFPLGLDQPSNAAAAVARGFGIRMSLGDFDAERLLAAINDVLTNPKYRVNAELASAILRDCRESPAERASRAIEHVIKYGDRHLRTGAYELNTLQFIMFDVFAFLFVVAFAVFVVSVLTCRCVVKWMSGCIIATKRKQKHN